MKRTTTWSPSRSIEESWQGYAAALGIPVGGVQWSEMRKAFYAGCSVLLGAFLEISKPDFDEDLGVHWLESFRQEIHHHIERERKAAGL